MRGNVYVYMINHMRRLQYMCPLHPRAPRVWQTGEPLCAIARLFGISRLTSAIA
jgi:hypothetical protein